MWMPEPIAMPFDMSKRAPGNRTPISDSEFVRTSSPSRGDSAGRVVCFMRRRRSIVPSAEAASTTWRAWIVCLRLKTRAVECSVSSS